jgi:hypothetical protein
LAYQETLENITGKKCFREVSKRSRIPDSNISKRKFQLWPMEVPQCPNNSCLRARFGLCWKIRLTSWNHSYIYAEMKLIQRNFFPASKFFTFLPSCLSFPLPCALFCLALLKSANRYCVNQLSSTLMIDRTCANSHEISLKFEPVQSWW